MPPHTRRHNRGSAPAAVPLPPIPDGDTRDAYRCTVGETSPGISFGVGESLVTQSLNHAGGIPDTASNRCGRREFAPITAGLFVFDF
jgi:hypothetical protein